MANAEHYPGKGLTVKQPEQANLPASFLPIMLDAYGDSVDEHVMLYLCTFRNASGQDFSPAVKARIEAAAKAFAREIFQIAYAKALDETDGAETPAPIGDPIRALLDAVGNYLEAHASRLPGRNDAMDTAADRFANALSDLLARRGIPPV